MPKYLILLLVIALPLMSCSLCKRHADAVPPTDTVSPDKGWTIADSREAAASLAANVLALPLFADFAVKYDRSPVIMVDSIRNLTDENISMDGLVKDFSRELMKSGKVRLVTLREDRPLDPENPDLQADNGKGVDYVFKGALGRDGSLDDGARSRLYHVELSMADNHSGELVWQGIFKLQKQNMGN